MSTPVIAFLGWDDRRTFLVYHLAWMYAELGYTVVVVDLDPQAVLTASFLVEEKLDELWHAPSDQKRTIVDMLRSVLLEEAEESDLRLEAVMEDFGSPGRLILIPGDPAIAEFEDDFSRYWINKGGGPKSAIDPVHNLQSVVHRIAGQQKADLVLVDPGFYPSAVTRAAWLTAKFGIFAVSTDPRSVRVFETLGEIVSSWRIGHFVAEKQSEGYVVLSHPARVDQPSYFLETSLNLIPEIYQGTVLSKDTSKTPGLTVREDTNCLGILREASGLLDMAREARKPVFLLKPADGAIGSLALAVQDAYRDFERLALRIAGRVGLPPIP